MYTHTYRWLLGLVGGCLKGSPCTLPGIYLDFSAKGNAGSRQALYMLKVHGHICVERSALLLAYSFFH